MQTILPEHKNPILRDTAANISLPDITGQRIQRLIQAMKALLAKEKHGVALAAPQVGESLRLFIVSGRAIERDSSKASDEPDHREMTSHSVEEKAVADQVYINPVMLKMSRGKKGKHEGCLSIRGKWGIVLRAEKASVRAYDERGKVFTRGASGFLAHVFQHEIDHLNGILYTDKATKVYDEQEEKRS